MPIRSSYRARAYVLLALGTLLSPAVLAAQNTKLNGPLAPPLRSVSVSDYRFTSDGTRVVYRADREANQRSELFSRPLDGSGPSVKLNGPMQPDGDVGFNGNTVGSFQIGAGDRVAYAADENVNEVRELFSVPADGGASRVRLSQAGLRVALPVQLDPAGTHVVYHESSGTFGDGPLYTVPIDGSGAPLALTPDLGVREFWISPDGTMAVCAVLTGSPSEHLYAVPLDGSAVPLHLAETHPSPQLGYVSLDDVTFAPDGRVLYNEVDEPDDNLVFTLYSVPLDGSQGEVLITSGSSYLGFFALDPTSLPVRVTFPVNGRVASAASNGSQTTFLSPAGWTAPSQTRPLVLGNEVLFSASLAGTGATLFRAPIDGSQAATALMPAAGSISSYRLASPTEVAFIRSFTGTGRQLTVVPLAGGTPVPLHALPPSGQGPLEIVPHPDGERVLFRGDNGTFGVIELYVAPLDASSAPLKLNGPLAANADVLRAAVTPDPEQATYLGGFFGGLGELFRVPLDGSAAPFQLNEVGGDVVGVHATPEGSRIVYRADQASDEDFDLYAVDPLAPGTQVQLSAGLPSVLPDLAFSPLGDRVVFVTQGAQFSLRASALASGASIQLDSSTLSFVAPFECSADGTRVVYRRTVSGSDAELRSVALDGLSPPAVLHAPLAAGRTVSAFDVGPAGVVVFLSDLEQDEVFELYAVPIEGGTPLRISRPLATGGNVTGFQVDPTGKFAVFIADALLDDRFELFSVRLDGSPGPTRLSGVLPVGGDVTDFRISPAGGRVVYRADQVSDQRFDLFSVPIGGAPPALGGLGGERRFGPVTVRLSGQPANRAVQPDWVISPDGSQVVYRANQDALADFELFRAPLDGSAPPVQLSAPLVAGGDVLAFALAPDQSLVVYLADQRVDDVDELFSVSFGGGSAVALDLMPAAGDVSAFRISPDSSDVVYLADRDTDGVPELFRASADASGAPVKVNPSLPAGRAVEADFIALDLGTVYRADQVLDDVIELFQAQ
jgi:Tol biopolymer transport system component